MDLKDYRMQMDILDQEIMRLMKDRFKLAKEIGQFKQMNNIPIESPQRDLEILSFTSNYKYANEIRKVYQTILSESKDVQDFNYYLVGKSLPYTKSKEIHEESFKILHIHHPYQIFETDDFNKCLELGFKGINVTIPYKYDAYKACDYLDIGSTKTQSVNTIVNVDGKLHGFNTDYHGSKHTLIRYGFNLRGKKVIIIGNGATSRTLTEVVKDLHCKQVTYLVRTIRNKNEDLISNYRNYLDYDYIINTTSYGTYPNFEVKPLFPLDEFKHLLGVFDVIYNPINTPLLLEAKRLNIPCMNGLFMLVSQAIYADYAFLGRAFNSSINRTIERVYKKIKLASTNISFIGMPHSGKSYKGKRVASKLNMPFVDSDDVLKSQGNSLEECLKNGFDEAYYRMKEKEVIASLLKSGGKVISTGGGVITTSDNNIELMRNSIVVYIKQSFEFLDERRKESNNNRPLSQDSDSLRRLYDYRIPIYESICDLVIDGDESIEDIVSKIIEKEIR